MRILLASALLLGLDACFQVIGIPFATDPRIMRGAWTGQMDATCISDVGDAQVNADNSRLVSSGTQAAIWNFATGVKIAALERSVNESINQVRWQRDGTVIGVVQAGGLLMRRWQGDGRIISNLQLPSNSRSTFIARDGSKYALVLYNSSLKRDTLEVFDSTGGAVSSGALNEKESPLGFSDDGHVVFTFETVFSTTNTNTLRVRSSATNTVLHSVDLSKFYIYDWAVRGAAIWGYSVTTSQLIRIDSSGAVTARAFKIGEGESRGIDRFSISPDEQRAAVRTSIDARIYELNDPSADVRTIADIGFGASLDWSSDGQRLVLGFAEPRGSVLNSRDVRLAYTAFFGLRCGLSSVSVGTGQTVKFIESERERIAVTMQLEANYISDRQYAISGTATIGAVQYTVTGEGNAERDERLFAAPPAVDGHQIALTLRDTVGGTIWKTGNRRIALPKRDFDISPLNALGLLERVSDGKPFLVDLERR